MTKQKMVEEIKDVLGNEAPSMTFMNEESVKALYGKYVASNRMEETYEEVIKNFFGITKGITSGDVTVPKEALKKVYKPLNLKGNVFRTILEAHNTILVHGHETGNERVIVIDRHAGEIIADEVGSNGQVKWRINKSYKGEIITIHNHPQNTPFSTKDLFTFNDIRQTRIMCVQCHNGAIYSLYKPAQLKYALTEKALQDEINFLRTKNRYDNLETGKRDAVIIADIVMKFGWIFSKEV